MMIQNFKNAELIEVIRVVVTEGEGKEGSPFRNIVYFLSKDGRFLAKNDPCDNKTEEE